MFEAIKKALEGDADASAAFNTVMCFCSERGGSSPQHAIYFANQGRNHALDRKSDRWATAYARVISALESSS